MNTFLPKLLNTFHVKIAAILILVSPVKDEHIPPKTPEHISCENCGNTHFFKDGGFLYCKKCFYSVGRVFIKEVTFKDRCCFKQKCIYKRTYHYQNKKGRDQ